MDRFPLAHYFVQKHLIPVVNYFIQRLYMLQFIILDPGDGHQQVLRSESLCSSIFLCIRVHADV